MIRGLDLRDLFTGAMSWRRFQVVLDHLPSESAYVTAVRNSTDLSAVPEPQAGVFGPWAHSEFLLAGIYDRLGLLAHMQSDGKAPMPEPYPRPGVSPRASVSPISPKAAAYLAYLHEHRGEAPPEGWEPEVV